MKEFFNNYVDRTTLSSACKYSNIVNQEQSYESLLNHVQCLDLYFKRAGTVIWPPYLIMRSNGNHSPSIAFCCAV